MPVDDDVFLDAAGSAEPDGLTKHVQDVGHADVSGSRPIKKWEPPFHLKAISVTGKFVSENFFKFLQNYFVKNPNFKWKKDSSMKRSRTIFVDFYGFLPLFGVSSRFFTP